MGVPLLRTAGGSKKNDDDGDDFVTLWPDAESQYVWILSAGDFSRRADIVHRWPLCDFYAALHCYWISRGVPVIDASMEAEESALYLQRCERLRSIARSAAAAV